MMERRADGKTLNSVKTKQHLRVTNIWNAPQLMFDLYKHAKCLWNITRIGNQKYTEPMHPKPHKQGKVKPQEAAPVGGTADHLPSRPSWKITVTLIVQC